MSLELMKVIYPFTVETVLPDPSLSDQELENLSDEEYDALPKQIVEDTMFLDLMEVESFQGSTGHRKNYTLVITKSGHAHEISIKPDEFFRIYQKEVYNKKILTPLDAASQTGTPTAPERESEPLDEVVLAAIARTGVKIGGPFPNELAIAGVLMEYILKITNRVVIDLDSLGDYEIYDDTRDLISDKSLALVLAKYVMIYDI